MRESHDRITKPECHTVRDSGQHRTLNRSVRRVQGSFKLKQNQRSSEARDKLNVKGASSGQESWLHNSPRLVVQLTDINRKSTSARSKTYLKQTPTSAVSTMKTTPAKHGSSKQPQDESTGDNTTGKSVNSAADLEEDNISLKDLKHKYTDIKSDDHVDDPEGDTGNSGASVGKKRGRKPKSADNSPKKENANKKTDSAERRVSPSKRKKLVKDTDVDSNKAVSECPEIKVKPPVINSSEHDTPLKTRKSSLSPRKKKTEKAGKDNTNEISPPGKKGRKPSESPSPNRKKSPRKSSEVSEKADCLNSPKSSPKKTKVSPDTKTDSQRKPRSPKKEGKNVSPQNKETDKVKGRAKKASPEKSPRKKKNDGSDSVSSSETPESKTVKPRSRSNSNSPTKRSGSSPKKQSDKSPNAVRALEFSEDDQVKELILNSAKVSLPSDFKYQYTSYSGSDSDKALGLNDLISKVNSSIKKVDPNLTALFGAAFEPERTSSPEVSETSEAGDSDKTITEFDTSKISQELEQNASEKDIENSSVTSVKDKLADTEAKAEVDCGIKEDGDEQKEDSKRTVAKGDVDDSNKDVCKDDERSEVKNCDNIEEPMEIESRQADRQENTNTSSLVDDDNLNDSNTSNNEKMVSEEVESPKEKMSIFDMFGLKLKNLKPKNNKSAEEKLQEKSAENVSCDLTAKEAGEVKKETETMEERSDDDVMIVSETRADDSIVISDDEMESGVDRSGYKVLKESKDGTRSKAKFITINNIVEAKPLEILKWNENVSSTKNSAFSCDALDEYLQCNKENVDIPGAKSRPSDEFIKVSIKEELEKAEPDIDEINGIVFVSFETENTLKAHVNLEKKIDWMCEGQLRRLAQLKQMKERQQDAGSRRITDVKSVDELKQSFRGLPMRMFKYHKQLKQELEDLMLGRTSQSPENSPLKVPQKTADITKIKGWKNKFQNAEELQEATGINISETGKLHWKTEERLLKNLDPEDVKDIGLDLKRKRRKIVSYMTNKRRNGKGDGRGEGSKDLLDYDYEIDESVVTEHDVYNEEDELPQPDKIPYAVKYLSQHKYGMRKQFVKRMKLDQEDEEILKKLGTQKFAGPKDEEEQAIVANLGKGKKPKMIGIGKLTSSMAIAAVSALNKKLIQQARKLAKMSGYVPDEPQFDEEHEMEDDHQESEAEESPPAEQQGRQPRPRSRASSRRQSVVEDTSTDPAGVQIKQEPKEEKVCSEPGCRYGCICHLCKLSDSGDDQEPDKPPCDKEYCRLGCICESIDTKTSSESHCRKPGCMLQCKCPPKQAKPDIPRAHSRRRKKGRSKRRRSNQSKPVDIEAPETAEINVESVEDEVEVEEEGEDPQEGVAAESYDQDDWEPPGKKKKRTSNPKFADLPRRKTTYRLAKNLDAVSRKAMEVYASSEVYMEQKSRRRRSDQKYDEYGQPISDGSLKVSPDMKDLAPGGAVESASGSQPEGAGGSSVLEISDSDGEPVEDAGTCCRSLPYTGPYLKRSSPFKPKESSKVKQGSDAVIDLVESDKEDNARGTSRRKYNKSNLPSTSQQGACGEPEKRLLSVSEKMGIARNIHKEPDWKLSLLIADKIKTEAAEKFKTQMVCLKARKKPTLCQSDESTDQRNQISLLEIISNCPWETQRNNMLSKISHAISKDMNLGVTTVNSFVWMGYNVEFLKRAEKPAVIPPELKSKLPSEIYSIRIRVTEMNPDAASSSNEVIEINDADMEEKKKYSLKLQKKLIEKIKFAERLRNMIINEEQRGVTSSKFSVSREGIERALKKYKTQLWKAYTGSGNLTVEQLKHAIKAAKSGKGSESTGSESGTSEKGRLNVNVNTMARIVVNQGLRCTLNAKGSKFIPLEIEQASSATHVKNLTGSSVTVARSNFASSLMPVALGGKCAVGKTISPSSMSANAGFYGLPQVAVGDPSSESKMTSLINVPPTTAVGSLWQVPTSDGHLQVTTQSSVISSSCASSTSSSTNNALETMNTPRTSVNLTPVNMNGISSPNDSSEPLKAAVPGSSKDVVLIPMGSSPVNAPYLKGTMFMVNPEVGGTPLPQTLKDGTKVFPVNMVPKSVSVSLNKPFSEGSTSVPRVPSPDVLNSSVRRAFPGSLEAVTQVSPSLSSSKPIQTSSPPLPNLLVSHITPTINPVRKIACYSTTCYSSMQAPAPVIYPIMKAPVSHQVRLSTSLAGLKGNDKIYISDHALVPGMPVSMVVSSLSGSCSSRKFGQMSTPVASVMTSPSRSGRPITSRNVQPKTGAKNGAKTGAKNGRKESRSKKKAATKKTEKAVVKQPLNNSNDVESNNEHDTSKTECCSVESGSSVNEESKDIVHGKDCVTHEELKENNLGSCKTSSVDDVKESPSEAKSEMIESVNEKDENCSNKSLNNKNQDSSIKPLNENDEGQNTPGSQRAAQESIPTDANILLAESSTTSSELKTAQSESNTPQTEQTKPPTESITTAAELNSTQAELKTIPVKPNIIPGEPCSVPVQSNSLPAEPKSIKTESEAIPVKPSIIPAEPSNVPAKQSITPAEQIITPAESDATPAESDAAPTEHSITPAEPCTSYEDVDAKLSSLMKKRKRDSQDYLDEQDLGLAVKKACGRVEGTSSTPNGQESEDSDVDVMSLDTANDSPSNITKTLMQSRRVRREQLRRKLMNHLYTRLAHIVYKYHPRKAELSAHISKGLVLREAKGLISALQMKFDALKECQADAIQYNASLKERLQNLLGHFEKNGTPELVMRNFLKSIQCALTGLQRRVKKGHPEGASGADLYEDPDRDLFYNFIADGVLKEDTVEKDGQPVSEMLACGSRSNSPSSERVLVLQPGGQKKLIHLTNSSAQDKALLIEQARAIMISDSEESEKSPPGPQVNVLQGQSESHSDGTSLFSSRSVNAGRVHTQTDKGPSGSMFRLLESAVRHSDEDCEIRSTTGDEVLDHDLEFHDPEHWDDVNQSEALLQT